MKHRTRWAIALSIYIAVPMTITYAAVAPIEEPVIEAQPYEEMYEYVEFLEYVEIDAGDPYPVAQTTSTTVLAVLAVPEADVEPEILVERVDTTTVPEPEPAPEPEPERDVQEAPSEPEAEPDVVEDTVPEPAPTTTVAAPTHSSGVEQWRGLVEAYFPSSEVETALCIMHHESRGDPGATNGSSGAAGLFQFIPSTWNNMVPDDLAGDVYDPETNVRAAAWLQGAEGWSQWSPWNRGSCH